MEKTGLNLAAGLHPHPYVPHRASFLSPGELTFCDLIYVDLLVPELNAVFWGPRSHKGLFCLESLG